MYLFEPAGSLVSLLVFHAVCMPLRSVRSFGYMFGQPHLRCKTGLMSKKFPETTGGIFLYFLKNVFLKKL